MALRNPSATLRHDPQAGHPLISSTEDATPAWLQSVLTRAGEIKDERIVAVTATPIGDGIGMMASNTLLQLQYASKEAQPATLVAKFSSTSPESRSTGAAIGMYKREVCFYQNLAPKLDVVPAAYFSDISEDQLDFCILMENLLPARQVDQLEGCSLADAQAVIDAAANFHATFWQDHSIESMDWLAPMPPEIIPAVYKDCVKSARERFGDQLTSEHFDVIEGLSSRIEQYYTQLHAGLWTVTHQDLRLDNIMFSAHGGLRPVTILDWQTTVRGPAVTDISYFIGTSLVEDLRRKHERDLVERYYAGLQSHGVQGYTAEQCWHDYRLFSLQGVILSVIAAMLTTRTQRGDQLFNAMIRRSTAQALELNSLSLIA